MVDPWGYYNYQDVGRSRLTNYFTDTTQPGDVVEALLAPMRDIERVHHALFDMLSIYRTTGAGLDSFGELVKVARLGMSDEDYRQAILARRFSSGGSGTPEEIKRALKNIVVGSSVVLVDHFPAAFVAVIRGAYKGVDALLPQLLASMSLAGVAAYETHDYGLGGFRLSGVAGRLYNALGIGPTASGKDDQALGVKTPNLDGDDPNIVLTPIVPVAAGVQPLTMDSAGYSYRSAAQQAKTRFAKGDVFTGVVHREGDAAVIATTIARQPTASVATLALVAGTNNINITGVGIGSTTAVLASPAGDTLHIGITISGNDVLGVNEAYATLGGTNLAGYKEVNPGIGYADYGSRDAGVIFFGTFPEPTQ